MQALWSTKANPILITRFPVSEILAVISEKRVGKKEEEERKTLGRLLH